MSRRFRALHTATAFAAIVTLAVLGTPRVAAAQHAQPETAPPPPAEAAPPPPADAPPPPPTEAAPPPAGGQPATPPPPPVAATPEPLPEPDPMTVRVLEDQLRIGVGGEFFVFLDQLVGNGPAFLLAAHWMRWWGPFMLGGGTSIHYSYLIESREPRDTISQLTLNGEAMIGGGLYGVFAVYLHVVLGGGVAFAYDGETDTKMILPWIRAVAGLGAHVHVIPQLSVGALVDVGWPGTVEALATVAFHYD